MAVLSIENISHAYRIAGGSTPVLKGVSFSVERGELVAIQGRSGSGKSTLFYVLGGMLKPDEGRVLFGETVLSGLSGDALAELRNRHIGFVFQQFHLLARSTVLDNILLPTRFPAETSTTQPGDRERAIALAKRVGLGERLDHHPNQLSGGEQQRVAIARALMREPEIILADEPTGNLDSANADAIMELLKEIRDSGKTVLLITHEPDIAARCSRVIHLQDGKVLSDERVEPLKTLPPVDRAPAALVRRSSPLRLLSTVFPLAMKSIARNKTRAFLTMIGVTIGIAALFAMITFGKYARDQILAGFEELGVNAIMIRGYPNDARAATEKVDVIFQWFDYDKDLKPLLRLFPQVKYLSPVMMGWGITPNYGGRSIPQDVSTWGISAEYHGISRRGVVKGGPITPLHVERRSAVCLIGTEVEKKLFKEVSPIGQILFMAKQDGNPYPCRVIGVLAHQSSNMDWRKPNLDVVMPWTYFRAVSSQWEAAIHSFVSQVREGHDVEQVGGALKNYFSQKYGASGEFMIDANTRMVAQVKKSVGLFTLLLSSIALITLAVGGMGINNMMLVSLAERFKEIGLLKAVGATDRSLRVQFLLESTLLSGIAGIIGILAGFSVYQTIIFLASRVVSKLTFAWVMDWTALVISLVSVVGVGIASGLVPAIKAERLSVIEALRSE